MPIPKFREMPKQKFDTVQRAKIRNNSKFLLNGKLDITTEPDLERPWKCERCDRQYKWKYSLNHHVRHECGIPPKYKCERCVQYKTNIYGNFKRHQLSCENKSRYI